MKNLLNIVNQKQTPIDEEKLILLCLHCYIWGHFGITQEESCSIPDQKQLQMLRKFYFDLGPTLSKGALPTSSQIDSSIGNAIKNSSSITMIKIIENGNDKSQLTVSAGQAFEKNSLNLWSDYGYFGSES